jgi:hypothetical protein
VGLPRLLMLRTDAVGGTSALISIAGIFNYMYIILVLVAIFLVKNHKHVKGTRDAGAA